MSSEDDSSSAQPSSSSDEEEEWNAPKKQRGSYRARKKRATPPKRRNPRRYTTQEMDREIRSMRRDDSESSEEEVAQTPRRRVRNRRSINASGDDSDESEESEEQEANGTPSRPTRICVAATQRKLSSAVKADLISEREALGDALEESEVEMLESSDSSESAEKRPAKRVKKKSNQSSDEEYKDGLFNDDSSDNDSEDYESDESIDRESSRPRRSCARNKTSYKVNDRDIGTADEDSVDENTGPSILVSPSKKNVQMPYGSPKLREKARAKRKPLSKDESSDGESHNHTFFQHKCAQKRSPSKLKTTNVDCPSTHDEITMMELPKGKPHICYIAPDKTTRHCFTLETFYRIAISKNSSSQGPLQLLQPPHFRTPISDDLLDQIGSRFGRGALKVEDSVLYKKMKARNSGNYRGDITGDDDDMDNFDSDGEYIGNGQGAGAQNFDQRFQRYIQTCMGSSDVYCCPLCYIEGYRRLGNMGDEEMIEDDATDDEEGNEQEEDRFSFLDDPMTILGALDHQAFEIAATFCFRLLSGLKNHLRSVHHVNVKVIEGNDLFKRFQIRAPDGLLQSWLQRSLQKRARPGDMMRYWNEGANQSFLLLLNQLDRGELEGEQSGDYGSQFSESFPNRARRLWTEVSSPFLKVQDDMVDFLADEDDDDDEETAVPINPNFTPTTKDENVLTPEESMVAYLKRKNSQTGVESSEDEDGSSSSDELEVLSEEAVEEEEEEKDEWMMSKQFKAKRALQNNDSDSDVVFDKSEIPSTPNANGHAKMFETDDSGDEKPPARNSSARKRLEDSSDEEVT